MTEETSAIEKLKELYTKSIIATKGLGVSFVVEYDLVDEIVEEFDDLQEAPEDPLLNQVLSTEEWDAIDGLIEVAKCYECEHEREAISRAQAVLDRYPRPEKDALSLEDLLELSEKGLIVPEHIKALIRERDAKK